MRKLVVFLLLGILFVGCTNIKYVKEIETQEVYVPVPVDIKKVECRYQEANDIDELVNYLLECVINYEAYLRTLKTDTCKLEKKQ